MFVRHISQLLRHLSQYRFPPSRSPLATGGALARKLTVSKLPLDSQWGEEGVPARAIAPVQSREAIAVLSLSDVMAREVDEKLDCLEAHSLRIRVVGR